MLPVRFDAVSTGFRYPHRMDSGLTRMILINLNKIKILALAKRPANGFFPLRYNANDW
ncbi:MAG: hypothetical protein GY779_04965 [Gammaproteobacteria bacterium]|nr:hypothetical protein [Gammaproteobacteria bacterium]